MSDESLIWLLVAGGVIFLVLIAVSLALGLLIHAFGVAVRLLVWAGNQGFVGIAVYVACWVFMFPVMAVICLIVGLIQMLSGLTPWGEPDYDRLAPPHVPRRGRLGQIGPTSRKTPPLNGR